MTDLELPVTAHDLDRRPMDVAAVKQVFERLQFRTLTERVLKIAEAEGADMGSAEEAAPRTDLPIVRTLVDEELAKWLESTAGSEVAVIVDAPHGELAAFGLATETETVQVNWAAHRPDYAALEAWLSSDAPKLLADAKTAASVLARLDIPLAGVVWDSRLAAWLERPGAKSYDLVDLVHDVLGEALPQADPNQLVPDTESISPATVAWFLLRLVAEQRQSLPATSERVLAEIDLPSAPVLALMQRTGIAVDRAALEVLNAELGETTGQLAQQAFAEIGREVNLGSPKHARLILDFRSALGRLTVRSHGHIPLVSDV